MAHFAMMNLIFTPGGARHPDPRASVRAVGVEAAEVAARRGVQVDAARGVREGDAGDTGEGADGQRGHERGQRGAGRENLQNAVNIYVAKRVIHAIRLIDSGMYSPSYANSAFN